VTGMFRSVGIDSPAKLMEYQTPLRELCYETVLLFRGVLVGFAVEEFGRGEPVQGVLLGRPVDTGKTGDTTHAVLLKSQALEVLNTAGSLCGGNMVGDLFM
jgi:hypothetical protein